MASLGVYLFENQRIIMGPNREIDFKFLLGRMLSGELTNAENDDLQSYIQNTYRNNDLYLLMHEHWLRLENNAQIVDETQMLILKNRIFTEINKRKNSLTKTHQFSPSNWMNYFIRAAAILFIPLLISSLLALYQLNTRLSKITTSSAIGRVVANPGSRVHFTLPDQTEVWLNSGSLLEYPLAMGDQENRKVKLSGQGYFKVAHDAARPFIVQTREISIKALGTSFDVSVYAEDNQISSTLEEGTIALIDLNDNEVTRITPGQKAFFDKTTHTIVVKDVATLLTTSWKDGKLIFRNTALPDVTAQLERWFNCKIYLDPQLLNAGLTYTATIQDETLGEVLKMIEISTRIKTRIEKREVYIERKN